MEVAAESSGLGDSDNTSEDTMKVQRSNIDSPNTSCSSSNNDRDDEYDDNNSDSNDDDDEDDDTIQEQQQQQQFDVTLGIKEPNPTDILCGRGRSTSTNHPANKRFRELVDQHKQAYQHAKRREEKSKITYELVDLLRKESR
jgi:hypothetical protein